MRALQPGARHDAGDQEFPAPAGRSRTPHLVSHSTPALGDASFDTTRRSPGYTRKGIEQTERHWSRRRVGALVAAVAAMAITAGALLQHRGPAPDPRTVAALVELARLQSLAPVAADEERAGHRPEHRLELGDHKVALIRRLVDGREVLVAISDRAFSMPADARPLGRERDTPLLAKRGDITIACLSQPTHMLLAGPLPPERLVDIGRWVGDQVVSQAPIRS